jgi:hypothetical protein
MALISDNTFFTVKGNCVFHVVNVRIPRCFFAQEVNFLPGMAASVAQAAKRAFVAVLLALARQYGVGVGVDRDSNDDLLEKTFRRAMGAKDLEDLQCGRAPVDKAAFELRVQRLLQTRKAKEVASNCTLNLKKVCAEVVRKDGAASRT